MIFLCHLHAFSTIIGTSVFDKSLYFMSHTDFADNFTLSKEAWEALGIDINDTFLLENFTYSNGVVLDRMFNNMANTHFTGLTVRNILFSLLCFPFQRVMAMPPIRPKCTSVPPLFSEIEW